jgi:hypothetical protein
MVHINNVQLLQEDVNISGYTLTRDSPGTNTFSHNRNNYESRSPKCIGYLDTSQNTLQATNFSYIKQYSNQSGLTEYICDTASTSNIEILECFQLKALPMIVDAPWYVPNMVI